VTAEVEEKVVVIATKVIPLSDQQMTLSLFQRDGVPLDLLIVDDPVCRLRITVSLFDVAKGRR